MLYKAQALGSHEVLGIHHMPGTYIYDCTHLQSTAIHCLLSDTVFQMVDLNDLGSTLAEDDKRYCNPVSTS
jgi:hypothetical protein